MSLVLRPYQQHALDGGDPQRGPGVIRCFARHRQVLAVLATGLGKTVLALEAMRRYHAKTGKRAIMISHREELVTQPIARGEAMGMRFGREQAEHRAGDEPFVSATVQTMAARLARFPRDAFGLIIVDEVHHATSAQYQQVLDHFSDAYVMGITATPQRLDGLGMADAGFTVVGYEMGISDAIALGWLVPIRWRRVTIDGLDLGALRIRGGDFEPEALAELMAENAHHVARHTVELARGRQTILFCVNVAHAHAQAEALRRYTDERVEVIDGGMSTERRRDIIDACRRGEVRYLCNCAIAIEGFDVPGLACVVLARPTRSVSLALQAIGRGTRPLPGVVDSPELHAADPELRRLAIATSDKPDMLLLDIAGVGDELSLATVADALAGKLTPEQRAQLLNMTPDGEETFDQMMSGALRLAAIEETRKQRKSEALRREHEINPFNAVSVLGMKIDDDPGSPRCDKETADWLKKHGVERPERLSEEAAKKAKKTICVRTGKGLASYRQMQALQSHGVPAKSTINMSRETASRLLAEVADNGGTRPAAWDAQTRLGGRAPEEARPPAAF